MNSHKNARLTFEERKLLVERIAVIGLIPAAEAAGISARTARKWRQRFEEHGEQGLLERSSRPTKTRTSLDETLRGRDRASAPLAHAYATHSYGGGAQRLHCLPVARPSGTVQPEGARSCGTGGALRARSAGELMHIDTKKLGRIVRPSHRVTGDRRDSVDGAGWEFAHVAIDNHSHVSFVQMHADKHKYSAVNFLLAAVAHYKALGVKIKRLITDNGPAYRSKLFAKTCQALCIKHSFTKPYRPQTNGKAERFIQTCLREWAYGRVWTNSAERTAWLPAFLSYYNERRPHSALAYKPPASHLNGNNLLQLNIARVCLGLQVPRQAARYTFFQLPSNR